MLDDLCTPNPCYNNGTCYESNEITYCTCPDGVAGNLCEDSKYSYNNFNILQFDTVADMVWYQHVIAQMNAHLFTIVSITIACHLFDSQIINLLMEYIKY